jgi:hypothetical protein
MTRDEWLKQFEDEVKKLRPHVGSRLAGTLALQMFDLKEHPRDLARQYDKSMRPPPPPGPAKKRAK